MCTRQESQLISESAREREREREKETERERILESKRRLYLTRIPPSSSPSLPSRSRPRPPHSPPYSPPAVRSPVTEGVEVTDTPRSYEEVTVLSSLHGRQRRNERDILKEELQAAVKYGTRHESPISCPKTGERRWIYKFNGVTYVTDSTSRKEVTSWREPGFGINIQKVEITASMLQEHELAVRKIREDQTFWASHTVVIVDQSGSMRTADTAEGATRSDIVWLTLAMELIKKQLDAKERASNDVFSVVSMQKESSILIDKQPTDMLLFNSIVDLLRTLKPQQDGHYLPAIDAAEGLLNSNPLGSCALNLMFLSDGKPSDHARKGHGLPSYIEAIDVQVRTRLESLAMRFGRRVTVGTIGFGMEKADYRVLESIVTVAKDYGCKGIFKASSACPKALAKVFTEISSTVTDTKMELIDSDTKLRRTVRPVNRIAQSKIAHVLRKYDPKYWTFFKTTERVEWAYYRASKGRIGKWSPKKFMNHNAFPPEVTVGVIISNGPFAEGAERYARLCYEAYKDSRGIIHTAGVPLVAKESRFLEDKNNERLKTFQRRFCKVQSIASRYAEAFNKKLREIPGVRSSTPRVNFLDCSVYMVRDESKNVEDAWLVEKMVDYKGYVKFNNNQGYVFRSGEENPFGETKEALQIKPVKKNNFLFEINEGSEEEQNEQSDHERDSLNVSQKCESIVIKNEDIPQAFSCFSYWYSKYKHIVVDLQGVFDREQSPPVYILTDPALHSRLHDYQSKLKYGRTDKGYQGILAFSKSHECSPLCKALKSRWLLPGEKDSSCGIA